MAHEGDVDAFVVARSDALLRTAYFLTQDEGLAEDLLQTAMTKAWFAWRRIDGPPEAYVRRVLVTTSASWWRRRWTRETPTEALPERERAEGPDGPAGDQDLWEAIGHLPPRQRATIDSDRPRIVGVYATETPALEDCAASLGQRKPQSPAEESAQVEEFDRRCATDLELRVDGQVPTTAGPDYVDFGFDGQALLRPGGARTVSIDVIKNDPRSVRYALVIWEARP